MKLAIQMAYLGANRVAPNPMVGCVVLDKSYKLLAYGYHEKIGGPHAEVNAFEKLAKEDLEGSHVFVTLEPCSHHGRTSPCSEYIASFPIESVTYGLQDPDPRVAGKGINYLREHGIKVYPYDGEDKVLEDLLDSFRFHLKNKECFYSLKVAASLDGLIRDGFGESKWITSQEAREHSHFLRSRFHAIWVGKNTLLQDDPSLNVRHPDFPNHQNKVILFNPSGDLLSTIDRYKVCQAHPPENIYLITKKENLPAGGMQHIHEDLYMYEEKGIHVLAPDYQQDFPFQKISKQLYANGILDILVEGGSKIHSYFLQNRFFHRLYYYQAHKILGAKDALSWTENLKFSLKDPLDLEVMSTHNFKKETLIKYAAQY